MSWKAVFENPQAPRYTLEGNDATFRLRDYLVPGGRYPYEQLAGDMEMAFLKGFNVSLLSVPEFLMVLGLQHANKKPWDVKKPWCTEGMRRKRYARAADAIRG